MRCDARRTVLHRLISYKSPQSDRSDKLQLTQTGTGGLSELREILDDTKASYAYVRVSYANDKESTREKFILVVCNIPKLL
jgi:hypothetical protein